MCLLHKPHWRGKGQINWVRRLIAKGNNDYRIRRHVLLGQNRETGELYWINHPELFIYYND